MLKVERKVFENVIVQIIESNDTRELLREFSKDTVFFHSLLKDISKGKDSPNYHVLKKVARDKKISEQFIIENAKSILSYLATGEPKEDYYKILNVPPTASAEEIRPSWLTLIKTYHPDKVGDKGLDITKKLNEAYEVLGDPVKRAGYDSRRLPELPLLVISPRTTFLNLGREMKVGSGKFIYSVSLIIIIFTVIFYLSESGLISRSTEEKRGLAKKVEEIKAPLSEALPTLVTKKTIPSKPEKLGGKEEGLTLPLITRESRRILIVEKEKSKEVSREREKDKALQVQETQKLTVRRASATKPEGEEKEVALLSEESEKILTTKEAKTEEEIPEDKKSTLQSKEAPKLTIEEPHIAKSEKGAFQFPSKEDRVVIAEEKAKEIPELKETLKEGQNKYIVREGDSLWKVARRFNTSVKNLEEANNLKSNRLDIGDVLIIPGAQQKVVKKEVRKDEVEKKGFEKSVKVAVKKEKEDAGSAQEFGQSQIEQKSKVAKKADALEIKSEVKATQEEKSEPKDSREEPGSISYPYKTSLYSFVSEYVSAYKSRDMNRFISLFEPGARENGVEISKTLSSYRDNFSSLRIIEYDVQVKSIDFKDRRAFIDGDFVVTFKSRNENTAKSSTGDIRWLLSWMDNKWKIKEINYRIKDTK
ncbi:MAG: DnaJ domain-containing protein [Deltaproteobacteria bacterium]|nr:DnaJ domain-containing protein [Deltaproteobacteria bacterium]